MFLGSFFLVLLLSIVFKLTCVFSQPLPPFVTFLFRTWRAGRTIRWVMFFASLCSSVSFGLIATVSRPWLLLSSNMSVGMLTCLFAAAGTFKGALDPLLFEYGTELAYPRSPATVGGLLTIGGAFQLHIFLFFFFFFF